MVTIAIDSRLPAVQRSRLADALNRNGHTWNLVDDLSEWAASHPRSVVFAAVSNELDPPLAEATNKQGVSLVAVAADTHDVSDLWRWLLSGFSSVVEVTADAALLRLQTAAALHGWMVISSAEGLSLGSGLGDPPPKLAPGSRELAILNTLASGGNLLAAARTIGRSERHTRRLLRDLLDWMQVPNSHAAVAQAAQRGWIPTGDLHADPGTS